jgi:hypothetical protein
LSTTALPPGSSATPSLRGNRQLPIRQSTCHVQRCASSAEPCTVSGLNTSGTGITHFKRQLREHCSPATWPGYAIKPGQRPSRRVNNHGGQPACARRPAEYALLVDCKFAAAGRHRTASSGAVSPGSLFCEGDRCVRHRCSRQLPVAPGALAAGVVDTSAGLRLRFQARAGTRRLRRAHRSR